MVSVTPPILLLLFYPSTPILSFYSYPSTLLRSYFHSAPNTPVLPLILSLKHSFGLRTHLITTKKKDLICSLVETDQIPLFINNETLVIPREILSRQHAQVHAYSLQRLPLMRLRLSFRLPQPCEFAASSVCNPSE